MYICHKQFTAPCTKKCTFSTFPFHPSIEKAWNFRYKYEFKSSNFKFLGYFVLPRLVKGAKPEDMVRSIKDRRFRGTRKTSNAADHIGFKAGLRPFSVQKESELDPKRFCVSDLESTLNHLSKWLLMTLLGTVLICRNDDEALWIACGSVVNAAISTSLKKILNINRPASSLRSDPGMPSSHAQTIFFTVICAIRSLFRCRGTTVFTVSLSGLSLAFGSYLSWLRVTQGFHTISQVKVGAILGTLVSTFWFWSWDAIVHEAFNANLWVRLIVDIGAVAFWIGFFTYIVRSLIVPKDPNV